MPGVPYSSYVPPSLGQINNVSIDPNTLITNDVIKFDQPTNRWVNGPAAGWQCGND